MKPATSNLVHNLGFAKAHHKLTPRKKCGWPWDRGAPKNFGFPYISAIAGARDFTFGMQLGFVKAYHKIHAEERVGVALD